VLLCAQNLAPDSISVNGEECRVQLNITLSNEVTQNAATETAETEEATVRISFCTAGPHLTVF
jgi:hypothetical protein